MLVRIGLVSYCYQTGTELVTQLLHRVIVTRQTNYAVTIYDLKCWWVFFIYVFPVKGSINATGS